MFDDYEVWKWDRLDLNGEASLLGFRFTRAYVTQRPEGWFALVDDRRDGKLHIVDSAGKPRARGPFASRELAEQEARRWALPAKAA